MQLVDSIEGAAVAGAVDALLVTQQNADRAGIAGPAQGWGPWAAVLSAAAQGQLEAAPADDSIGTLCTIITVGHELVTFVVDRSHCWPDDLWQLGHEAVQL